MRHFGTVKSFDETQGHGSIQPDRSDEEIGFERRAVIWHRSVDPTHGQRLSFEVRIKDGRTRAVNLQMQIA